MVTRGVARAKGTVWSITGLSGAGEATVMFHAVREWHRQHIPRYREILRLDCLNRPVQVLG
jgi:hypothetical protein